jgi:hypothetical protein
MAKNTVTKENAQVVPVGEIERPARLADLSAYDQTRLASCMGALLDWAMTRYGAQVAAGMGIPIREPLIATGINSPTKVEMISLVASE